MREISFSDRLLTQLDQALRTSLGKAHASRANPGEDCQDEAMSDAERQHAAGLMRINHSGEVCAQALYFGQALTARDAGVNAQMQQAANEETDHLAWCAERLEELDSHPSVLNPLWYAGSFAIGALAGAAGDRWSLGFVNETELQVEAHLEGHLSDLPEGDRRSRGIISVMAEDEARHARHALEAGGSILPVGVRRLMHRTAAVMKWASYRF
jgi:ubiquinone biosynthesis monooxygenase Coq7